MKRTAAYFPEAEPSSNGIVQSTAEYFARSVTGRIVQLHNTSHFYRAALSLDGSFLTASFSQTVLWWNLASGTHGRILVDAGNSVLGAGRDGVIEITNSGDVALVTPGGQTTSYGLPFPGTDYVTSGITGPDGILIVDSNNGLHYLAYSNPGTWIDLDNGGVTAPLRCTALSATDAACFAHGFTDKTYVAGALLLTPLEGGAATVLRQDCLSVPAIGHNDLVWGFGDAAGYSFASGCLHSYSHLQSLAAHGTTVEHSATRIAGPVVSAYGGAVTAGHLQSSLIEAASATSSTVIYRPARSRVTAANVVLSTGRVVDVDDRVDDAHRDQIDSVKSRPLTATGLGLALGPPAVIGRDIGGDPVIAGPLAASGETTVYAVDTMAGGGTYPLDGQIDRLRIVSPFAPRIVDDYLNVSELDTVSVSGNRALYRTGKAGRWSLLDLRTGKTTPLVTADEYALWGDYLYRLESAKSLIVRDDLATHTSKRVASAAGKPYGSISAYADHIAYQATNGTWTLRNVRSGATTTVSGEQEFLGWTSDGALIAEPGAKPNGQDEHYSVQTWSGKTIRLLSVHSVDSDTSPDVDGRTLAWINNSGALKVAEIAPRPLRPRALGAPYAPPIYRLNSGTPWRTVLPYSQSLTTCHVTISQHGSVVRRQACQPADARLGVAAITWRGETTGGSRVSPGTYQWKVTARGISGSAVNATGHPAAIHGEIVVKR